MQITFKQDELEIAVRDYMVKCGITRSVGEIAFTATRNGDGIETRVEVAELDATAGQITTLRSVQAEPSEAPVDVTEEEQFPGVPSESSEVHDSDVAADVDSSESLFS